MFTATKLSLGTNNNMLNYRSAKNRGYLLNSTLFRNIFSTKMCIIWAVARNIHTNAALDSIIKFQHEHNYLGDFAAYSRTYWIHWKNNLQTNLTKEPSC